MLLENVSYAVPCPVMPGVVAGHRQHQKVYGLGARRLQCADALAGGSAGGEIVAQGTPEEVAQCEASFTGQYLRPLLNL